MTVPEFFRKSTAHRKLFATMEYLCEHDPAGLFARGVEKSADQRGVVKAAVDRRRTVLEHRAADELRAYFREEREHVVHAIGSGAGHDVDAVLESLEPELAETYASVWGRTARDWGGWVARHARERVVEKADAPAYDYGAPIDAWIRENAGKRIAGITEVTRKKIAAEIAAGRAAGENLRQIARRIDKFYLEDIIPHRSMTIAVTEVGHAANWSQDFIAQDTAERGVPMEKEWGAIFVRTRDAHEEADGQRVPLDEPFDVGGEQMMFPGDESLGAGPANIINCHCFVMYHVADGAEAKAKAAESPEAPSPAEFAARVVDVADPDVITALAFARGVFGESDSWVSSRASLMKRVRALRRYEKAMSTWDESEHPRDEAGRFAESPGGGAPAASPSYSAENARLAEGRREHANGAVLRYGGGSKVALAPGEHVTVRGVYGMSEKTGVVYYNVETQNGRRLTLASRTLRVPEPGEVPTPPTPKPTPKPRTPRAPRAPSPTPAPPPAAADVRAESYDGLSAHDSAVKLSRRTGMLVVYGKLGDTAARTVSAEADRLHQKYAVPFARFTDVNSTGYWPTNAGK